MRCNAWVITRKSDRVAVLETHQRSVADKVNREAYLVETAHDYLCRLNAEIKAGTSSACTVSDRRARAPRAGLSA